jgi:cleavage and polyadenylation specificity factor subunit 5
MTFSMIALPLFDLDEYTMGYSEELEEVPDTPPKPHRLVRLREYVKDQGSVRSVRAIILVHVHNHPYVLLLQRRKSSEGSAQFVLPGGRLNPGEDDESGLQRLLNKKLRLVDGAYDFNEGLIATWYRPQFTDVLFPYLPVHITTPKETEFWDFVKLPEKGRLRIDPKYELSPVSFYDLEDGRLNHGKLLQGIPLLVSRFNHAARIR